MSGFPKIRSIPYFTPFDFGAAGNGVIDDTLAMQRWLAAATNQGAWAVLPKGTFLVNPANGLSVPIIGPACVAPPTAVNGLHIVGEGAGTSIIKSSAVGGASYQILANQGNDQDWIIEGIEITGPTAASLTNGWSVNAANGQPTTTGTACFGIGMDFMSGLRLRDCKVDNCSINILDFAGQSNEYDAHLAFARQAGIVFMQSSWCNIRNLPQNSAASGNNANTDTIANIVFCNINASLGGPVACKIDCPLIDEINNLNGTQGGQCVYIAAGTDCEINTKVMYAPGKIVTNPFYGIRLGQFCNRVAINGTRIQPFTVDTSRVPTHTIQIDAGATDCILRDVTTNPNAANGGGDIQDSGTRTIWSNVRQNDGPRVDTWASKAGAPVDGDYQTPPPIGTQVYDSTNSKVWIRTGAATWKGVAIA